MVTDKKDVESVEASAIDISYYDLDFSVVTKDKSEIQILKKVTGQCKSGKVTAIIGPSGAGKTTLLDIVAGNVYSGTLKGQVLVNGEPRNTTAFRKRVAYVLQRDIILSSATVYEILVTSAHLRLPFSMSTADKKQRVEQLIKDLDLEECRNTIIGNEAKGIKGVSGGQKKRVSVGQELVTDPQVIIMDEPTSGLDSEIALVTMTTLQKLARSNKTVVCTIHQPNSDIVETFDDFMMLSKGRVVYYGAWKESVPFFGRAGHQCPAFKNPTDFFMSLARKREAEEIADFYLKELDRHVEPLHPAAVKGGVVEGVGGLQRVNYNTPSWYQAYILFIRYMRSWIRDPMMFAAELTQYIFIAIFTGLMYLNVSNKVIINGENGAQDRGAAIWFLMAVLVFVPSFTATVVWENERLLLRKESQQGSYTVAAFYLAKTFSSLPVELAQIIVASLIAYFMIGLQATFTKFVTFYITLVIGALVAQAMGELCAIATPNAEYALIMLTFIALILLSFTGFLVSRTPVYFRWVPEISFMNYATAALIESEFSGLIFYDENGTAIPGETLKGTQTNGMSILVNILILLGIWLGLKVLGYIGLKIAQIRKWL